MIIGIKKPNFANLLPRSNRLLGDGLSPRPSVIFAVSHSSAGGAQELWANLAKSFQEAGYDVTLLALYPLRDDVRQPPEGLSWQYISLTPPRTATACFALFWKLAVLLRRVRPQTVFTAMPAANVLLAIAVTLAGLSSRLITSHHAPIDHNNRCIDAVDSFIGSTWAVTRVVCVSKAVAVSLHRKSLYYRNKALVITNALPPEVENQIEALYATHQSLASISRTIIATGRLASQKNYPLLIRAARLMPDVLIKIVGTGPDEERLKAMATELGVADRVTFLGFCERAVALQHLATGDVFVQPSLYEGHSLALVEAARLGKPLIVSDVPSQVEAITANDGERCGVVVNPHDENMLAHRIRELLDVEAVYTKYAQSARRLGQAASYTKMLLSYQALSRQGSDNNE